MSPAKDQDYLCEGMAEEIMNALVGVPGIRVASRTSAFRARQEGHDLAEIARLLSVGHVLEGSVRAAGTRLRVTARLTDAATGYQLWSERYDRVMEDVFAVQDEIASTIARRLRLSLAGQQHGRPAQPPTRHLGAYELYLKGRVLLYRRGLSILEAVDCFNEAVALDPTYAKAWAGLADGYTTSGYSGFKSGHEVMPRALEAARRALELEPDLAEAHNALACATMLYERDYGLAEQEFIRALELNPNYPQARAWYGLFYLQWVTGRDTEAREEISRLLELDPLSGYATVILAFSDFTSGRVSDSVEHARAGVELDPDSFLAHYCLLLALHAAGLFDEAAAAAERALAMSARHNWALGPLVSVLADSGQHDAALVVYREIKARSEREYVQPAILAPAAAAVGELDFALALAEQALEERDPLFVLSARSYPLYDRLRADARFLDIVSRLEFPGWSSDP
jgi:TolB-like protein/Tfp pilus assembly protein PilF